MPRLQITPNTNGTCLQCGNKLVPKVFRGGKSESHSAFRKRVFCNRECWKEYGPTSISKERLAEAVALYDAGLSTSAIAEKFGIGKSLAWALLKRRTTIRSHQETSAGKASVFHRGGALANTQSQSLLKYYVANGLIERPSQCEQCGAFSTLRNGRSGIQAHHCDYNKPLEVMWLCQKCHHEWHKHNQAIPATADFIPTYPSKRKSRIAARRVL